MDEAGSVPKLSPSSPRRAVGAISLVGGVASALLIGPTEFLSILAGPPIAGLLGAVYIGLTHPRTARGASISGALILLGSIVVMIGVIVIQGIAFAIFG
jgi:hypothetical protein